MNNTLYSSLEITITHINIRKTNIIFYNNKINDTNCSDNDKLNFSEKINEETYLLNEVLRQNKIFTKYIKDKLYTDPEEIYSSYRKVLIENNYIKEFIIQLINKNILIKTEFTAEQLIIYLNISNYKVHIYSTYLVNTEYLKNITNQECIICYEITDYLIKPKCKHNICGCCIYKVINICYDNHYILKNNNDLPKCPLCRCNY